VRATFTEADYARARAVLARRYPALAGSDVLDEMVQRAAVAVWTARCRGDGAVDDGLFRTICKRSGTNVARDAGFSKPGAERDRGRPDAAWRSADGARKAFSKIEDPAQDPVGDAETSEFLEALTSEERGIVEALMLCGGRRDMASVADVIGGTRARVYYVLWRLRRRLRETPM
jgi:hypothetical protein